MEPSSTARDMDSHSVIPSYGTPALSQLYPEKGGQPFLFRGISNLVPTSLFS